MQSLIHRNRVLLLHLSFWCLHLSFFLYQVLSHQRGADINWSTVVTVVTVQFGFAFVIGYFNYFILLPAFLRDRRIGRYLLHFAIMFGILISIRVALGRYLFEGFTGGTGYFYTARYTIQVVTTNLFIVIFLGMIRFAVDWFEFEARQKNVENERLTAELNFLKAQINPHFLFNTLNNLYYLAYSGSPNTTEVIAKLSQMMRYMIYDSNHPLVPLSKEIEYMENYISLERLRLNDQIPIKFVVSGEDPRNFMIAPLIFITFLENAFKHGVSNSHPGAWVNVCITIEKSKCAYRVENSKRRSPKPEAETKSGIGLQNVRRRLELSYPGKHVLTVDDRDDRFSVQLNIELS